MRAIARARVQIFSFNGTLSELIGCEGVYLWTTIADIAAVFRLATDVIKSSNILNVSFYQLYQAPTLCVLFSIFTSPTFTLLNGI